ncbi:hypothetical protein [Sabulibacter ruber]|uniref:hypothetical protein n=1 Tax=Sabulibacter ruber TaxID=2811901 RepID=UPI001A9688D5|nr:hypothetical protein [Sabulibacter ruber]
MKRYKRKLILILFSVVVFVVRTQAQTDSTKNQVVGGFLIMPLEFPVINKTKLNKELNAYGLPSANHPAAAIGIGLQLFINRFITTFSFNKTTRKSDKDTYLTEVEYRSTSFNVGYDLTKNASHSIYPYVGFKGSGLNYLYREKLPDETSMEQYLETDLRYKEITNSRGHLDLGFGVSHQSFYLVNCRIGYLLPLEKVRWNMNNNQTTLGDSPAIRYTYYFTLTLGIGTIVSERQARQHFTSR